uniref:Uncharacterized protein n=1 Tax=Chenopodium quinoa TaxID=63459 RepID=A0A803MX88_CHEQI
MVRGDLESRERDFYGVLEKVLVLNVYVPSHNETQWRSVIKTKPQNYFDFPNDDDNDEDESLWENVESRAANVVDVGEHSDNENFVVRDDVEPFFVDANNVQADHSDVDDENIDGDSSSDGHEEEFSDVESRRMGLPRVVAGLSVTRALSSQCEALY